MTSNSFLCLKRSSIELGIAMLGRCKRLKVEDIDKLDDRLSDLPINVKHHIQDYLSIEEAARMSVLSRSWRHVWASIPKLVFSPQFCQSKPSSDKLIDIVNTILSHHSGAIKTFHLNISSIPSSQHSVIDQWMLLLSTNGVRDLTLQNLDGDDSLYTLPSFMFGVELESLYLSSCIFRPPCSFRGFHKLKSLCLIRVTFQLEDVAAHSFLRMPNLVRLQVRACIGTLHHWKIYAPELLRLFYYTSRPETLKLDHLLGCRKLDSVILTSYKHQEKPTNLTCFLNCWPEVRRLYLDSYYLKSFAYSGSTEADRLPACLNNLRLLAPFYFDFDDEERIFSVLRMLRSCPNLEELLFTSNLEKKGGKEVAVNHFEGPAYRIQGLDKLKKLTLQNYRGTKNEFLFVRFILASAPLLLKTIIRVDPESVDKSQYLKISKELMGFPRASPELEMICELSKLDMLMIY